MKIRLVECQHYKCKSWKIEKKLFNLLWVNYFENDDVFNDYDRAVDYYNYILNGRDKRKVIFENEVHE